MTRAGLLAGLVWAGLVACERDMDDWQRDLRYHDPWHQRQAALALRSAGDEELELAVRTLLLTLNDDDPEVVAAARESLEVLAPRSVDYLASLLGKLPPERSRHRDLLLHLLRRQSEAGDARARAALERYLSGALGAEPDD
jgi:hypothetical protein